MTSCKHLLTLTDSNLLCSPILGSIDWNGRDAERRKETQDRDVSRLKDQAEVVKAQGRKGLRLPSPPAHPHVLSPCTTLQ